MLHGKDKESTNNNDRIIEKFRPDNDIPKKYRKSQRKMSALAE